MAFIFPELTYFERIDAMDGAMQMALDELLVQAGGGVSMRDYEWSDPCVSIGYFGNSSEILTTLKAETLPNLIRRPTGGGMVHHGHGMDFTYSLVVGAASQRAGGFTPRESYRSIHQVLAEVLREFGVSVDVASAALEGDGGAACFVNPVADDLMRDGSKIAGAGQRRIRGGLLHQGSVQPVKLPARFGQAFAVALAEKVIRKPLSLELLERAERLAIEKYRSVAWIRRR